MLSIDQIREYPFFAGLSDLELTRLVPRLTKRTYPRGAYLFHPGHSGSSAYLMESGLVRLFFTNAAGQEFLLNLVGPHEAFGLPLLKEDESRVMGAAVYRPAVVLSMSREDLFKSMDESPQLMRNVYQELTTTARKLLLHTQSLVTTHLDGRLATLLLRLARKDLNPVSMIDMPLSQAEIAGWLGASRGRLNRAMNRLTQQGLIRVDGQKILILDPAGLRRITGEQGNPPL